MTSTQRGESARQRAEESRRKIDEERRRIRQEREETKKKHLEMYERKAAELSESLRVGDKVESSPKLQRD